MYSPMSNGLPYWLGSYGPHNAQMQVKSTRSYTGTHNNMEDLTGAFNGVQLYGNGNSGHFGKVNTPYPTLIHQPTSNHNFYNANDGRYYMGASGSNQSTFQRSMGGFGSLPMPYASGHSNGLPPPAPIWNSNQQSTDVPDLAPRRNSLSSNEEFGPQTPFFGGHTAGFNAKMPVPDNSPQPWTTPSPHQLGQTVKTSPQQLWREENGYVVADLDAKCTQQPTIPRPIPAIFSGDKSRGTLETSLENKTHTTNVYIRGLHPNTTDEMLEAYGARFGTIASAKSMIDQHTGLCKGYVESFPYSFAF
jgi:hypothetical protein